MPRDQEESETTRRLRTPAAFRRRPPYTAGRVPERVDVNCPRCDATNPSHAKFCIECGARLAPRCEACGAELPPRARFCPECGARAAGASAPAPERESPRSYTPRHLVDKILTTRAALVGERKQVTVLFADLQDSLSLSERVDPEEWHHILDRFFAILTEGIHRFEGTVNQFTGDGVMALFGAPIAHEDHAQRACYAALRLRDELRAYSEELKRTRGLSLPVRMGLNSGEVVVGSIGDDLRMDYTAQGHTVGLAARLQQLADPGTAYVSAATGALVRGYFQLRDLGRFEIKGVSEPASVYELLDVGSVRTRLDVSRARGFSRFVGRAAEMAELEAALAEAAARRGNAVGLVGDAGIGKSRLCHEFLERCRLRGIPVYSAHAVPYGSAVPFLPVLSLFRSFFGITDVDTPQEARTKIAGTLVLRDEGAKEALPILFDFLGVPDPARPAASLDPETKQRALFRVLKTIASMEADEVGAVVTLIEDLHWLDAGSQAFLTQLGEVLAESRNLLLVNYRPGADVGWLEKLPYREIRLEPLGDAAIEELLEDLLGPKLARGELATLIRDRAAGNPFFVEESIRSLAETGCLTGTRGAHELARPVRELAIPPSVQSILAARIDRLRERDKEVLQTAAVIGKEFSETLLRRVTELPDAELDAALGTLEDAGFVQVERLHPVRRYAFVHPLTQEVAYRSQLGERRAEIHAAVARAIESVSCAEKLEECAALLAHHWEQAGDAFNAARWSVQAGNWARQSDLNESLRHYRHGLALLAPIPDSPETRALKMTAQAGIVQVAAFAPVPRDELARVFEEGKALAEQSRDPLSLARLLTAYGSAQASAGDADSALEHAKEAIRLAREANDAEFEQGLRATIMFAYHAAGRLREALEYASESDQRLFGRETMSFGEITPDNFISRAFRAMMITHMGRLTEARRELERAIQIARETGNSFSWMHASLVDLAFFSGTYAGAMNHARAAVETAEDYGSPFFQAVAYRSLGLAHVLNEEWDEARAVLERALEGVRSSRTALYLEGGILALLAHAALGLGDADAARERAAEAVAAGQKSHARIGECQARLVHIHVLLETVGPDAAPTIEAELRTLEALIEETGGVSYEPFVHLERAELAERLGDVATRERALDLALERFRAFGAAGHVEALLRERAG